MAHETNVIPLASRRALKKVKNDPVNQAPQQRPAPVAAAQAQSQRRCLVCQHVTGSYEHRYCEKHRGAFWRWLECIEPGCEVVGERKIPGQTVYRCPRHLDGRSVGEPRESDRDSRQPGREQVKALLAARRAALARDRERPPLPPRPPYNIGHYYADPRNRT